MVQEGERNKLLDVNVLRGPGGEIAKERCMEAYKKEKRRVKRCMYESIKEEN